MLSLSAAVHAVMVQNDEIIWGFRLHSTQIHFVHFIVFVLLLECGEVYGRLFDHKPVVRGEINFFLREFEVFETVL